MIAAESDIVSAKIDIVETVCMCYCRPFVYYSESRRLCKATTRAKQQRFGRRRRLYGSGNVGVLSTIFLRCRPLAYAPLLTLLMPYRHLVIAEERFPSGEIMRHSANISVIIIA